MTRGLRRLLGLPVDDYLAGLTAIARGRESSVFLIAGAAFVASWWIYVPIHELAHVLGCVATGGSVSRLEIAPWYGAAWLQKIFPFVVPASEYAGRLTGFDTRGSDLTYLATDFAPFFLTIGLGVPLLRSVREQPTPTLRRIEAAKLGLALPIAFAPFISLVGDYYEMGSILVSRLAAWRDPSLPLGRWRSDDVFRLLEDLSVKDGGLAPGDVVGIGMSIALGAILAWATYWLGALWAGMARGRSRALRP